MKLIMLGAPGAGKGTQAEMLAQKLNIPTISTGAIIREAIKSGTGMGAKAAEAEGMVNTLDEDDALVLLHLIAPRKSIKDAAEARAKVLAEGGGQ